MNLQCIIRTKSFRYLCNDAKIFDPKIKEANIVNLVSSLAFNLIKATLYSHYTAIKHSIVMVYTFVEYQKPLNDPETAKGKHKKK